MSKEYYFISDLHIGGDEALGVWIPGTKNTAKKIDSKDINVDFTKKWL